MNSEPLSIQLLEEEVVHSTGKLLEENREKIQLSRKEFDSLLSFESCSKIASDGSTRQFWRLGVDEDKPFCVIAAPAEKSRAELAESRSAWMIGNHLLGKDLAVPQLFGWDKATGILLFEDLGDIRLHNLVQAESDFSKNPSRELIENYRIVVSQLAEMQIKGADGFDTSWCWAGEHYDFQLMTEMESGYFLRAFWQGFLGMSCDGSEKEAVEEELAEIARLAAEAPANYFLHRDFQSRNIMLKGTAVRFIDFQAGRLGPLAYDLASLLIDPYCKIPLRLQEELLECYLMALGSHLSVDRDEFMRQYVFLAFQRNMQIVGAFSYLYKVRGKKFFSDFIKPSLVSLKDRLDDPLFKDYLLIKAMVDAGVEELK